jgi:crotonobetainyl-CoA:carnitine CoA-transferase CaiB-like acyl-CoA transferase
LILLAVGSDPQFQSLCAILNVPDLAQDPRFLTNPLRVQNRSELETLLQEEIRKWESSKLIASLKKAGIPHGLIKSVQQTLREAPPSVFLPERKGLYQAVFESTTWEKVQQMKLPGELGKDTVEILSRFLQMHENEIEALQREGVTGQRLNEGPIQPRE